MQQNIKATNLELTPSIRDYLEKRFSTFDRFASDIESTLCDVEVGKTTKHHHKGEVFRAEVNLRMSGQNFYAVSEKDDLYAAIDGVRDEILRQITSNKDKKTTLYRRGALRVKNIMKGLDFRGKFRRK